MQLAVLFAANARNDSDCRTQLFKLVVRVDLVRFRRCVAGKVLPDLHMHSPASEKLFGQFVYHGAIGVGRVPNPLL